jgi:hypothetical protein
MTVTAFGHDDDTVGRADDPRPITHDRDIAASLPRQLELRDGRVIADTQAGQDPR